LTGLVSNCKDKLLSKLSQNAQKDQELRLKDLIHDKICNLGEDFSTNLRESYSNTIDEYNSNLSHILKRGFGMDESQAYD